ncbi:MAG: hypothetical protein MR523_07735 [Lachnospiraceae bacterium]|nr:hypothetical protein [Lachnospiraceae bacterium]
MYDRGMNGRWNRYYEFEDTDPEVIDEIVEEIKEESKAEPEEKSFDWRGPLYISGVVFRVFVIVFAIVMIRKKK